MEHTDEELAKGIYPNDWQAYERSFFLSGLKKGRELEAEKAMRFAEWTHLIGVKFCIYNIVDGKVVVPWNLWYSHKDFNIDNDITKWHTTEELYNSEEFKEYLKQFEK